MTLSIIVAVSENDVIGVKESLPWKLPSDLKHFKSLTTGHPIIMGRKTYDSIGRPLPNRENLVVTRSPDLVIPGCLTFNSFRSAVESCSPDVKSEIFVIGGEEIYRMALPSCDRVYMTKVHAEVDGDAYFPQLDASCWSLTEKGETQTENGYEYSFLQYERR